MKITTASIVFAFALAPLPALAGPVTFSFTSGARSAKAEISASGKNLEIILTNTATADALVPTDILTALYLDITGNPVLTPVSAVVPLTSFVFEGGTLPDITPGDRVVGGEWAYKASVLLPPPNNQGVSSTGLGIFGPGDLFPGPDLQPPTSPDGVQYGITTAGDNQLTGNGGITGPDLIKNSVKFTLSGWSGEPDALITFATFQYGTGLDEPMFGAPEPTSLLLSAAGLVGLFAYLGGRRRRLT